MSRLTGVLLVAAIMGCAGRPQNDPNVTSRYGAPQRVTISGYAEDAMEPFISRDGRYLLFNNLNDPSVNTDLHFAERVDDNTFRYRGKLSGVNTTALEGVPTMDGSGTLYFVSPRSYPSSLRRIDDFWHRAPDPRRTSSPSVVSFGIWPLYLRHLSGGAQMRIIG